MYINIIFYVKISSIYIRKRAKLHHLKKICVGGQEIFFQNWKFACRKALRGGFGGMLPRENHLKWCNLDFLNYHFIYYFFLKNTIFYIKNKYSRYMLLSGNSHEEISENLRLMCFGVYILKES